MRVINFIKGVAVKLSDAELGKYWEKANSLVDNVKKLDKLEQFFIKRNKKVV